VDRGQSPLTYVLNFGPEMAENGWRVFAHPSKFSRANFDTWDRLWHELTV